MAPWPRALVILQLVDLKNSGAIDEYILKLDDSDIGALIQSKKLQPIHLPLVFFGAVGGFVWQTKVLVEEYQVDYDNLCTTPITADKDNLEFHQSSKNITEADLNDENEMNNAPSSSEMKSIMKSVRSYLDSYSNCEMNNKMDDIEQLETI
ncbi:hypothetical protein TNCV_2229541 [Trichonephila clavipes]|nr:hypothetical protein TNCV_2229541 [Trichonephila clavipes]